MRTCHLPSFNKQKAYQKITDGLVFKTTSALSQLGYSLLILLLISFISPVEAAKNKKPIAHAGVVQTVNEQTPVTLNASQSRDPDGTIASYQWQQISKSTVTLANATTANPTFTTTSVIKKTKLNFKLTVTDNAGAKASATTSVNIKPVNTAPVANAGEDQWVNLSKPVALSSTTSTDNDGKINKRQWQQIAGTKVKLKGATSATPSFTSPKKPTSLTFKLTITDNEGAKATDTVVITAMVLPTCTAPQVLQKGQCVTVQANCISPSVLQNGQCVIPVVTCAAPQVLKNGQCVNPTPTCVTPQTLVNGQCVAPVVVCTAPQILENGLCITPLTHEQITVHSVENSKIKTLSIGMDVVITELIVMTESSLTETQANEIFKKYNANVVGRIPEAYLYQLEISDIADESKLIEVKNLLSQEPGIYMVSLNAVSKNKAAPVVVPNDANWVDQAWAMRQIRAQLAWGIIKERNKINKLAPVKIGVIDSGFIPNGDINFSALYSPEGYIDNKLAFPVLANSTAESIVEFDENWKHMNHGMHVAGIIAAKGNNSKLTAGVAWQAPIDIVGARIGEGFSVLAHIARMVRSDVKAINLSFGPGTENEVLNAGLIKQREDLAILAIAFIDKLLDTKKDFLIVHSAGNEHADATYKTLFGYAFKKDNQGYSIDHHPKLGGKNFQSVRDRTIIVGATQAQLNYFGIENDVPIFSKSYSNFGNSIVEILAPGGDFSEVNLCISKNIDQPRIYKQNRSKALARKGYCKNSGIASLGINPDNLVIMTGTSMSTPHVTGAASLLFSVNSSLSAAQVKQILISTAKSQPIEFDNAGVKETYPLLNLEAAVKLAIETSGDSFPHVDLSTSTLMVATICKTDNDYNFINQGLIQLDSKFGVFSKENTGANLYSVEIPNGNFTLQMPKFSFSRQFSMQPSDAGGVEDITITIWDENKDNCKTPTNYEINSSSGIKIQNPDFIFTPNLPKTQDSIKFVPLISMLKETIGSYTWDFGDGETQSSLLGIDQNHSYKSPGTYQVKLTIRDLNGNELTGENTLIVSPESEIKYFTPQIIEKNQATTFTVGGTDLESGYVFSLPGCTATEDNSNNTTTERKFSCTPTQTGKLQLSVSGGRLAAPFTKSVLVIDSITDYDSDGMPDAWELKYNVNLSPSDIQLDLEQNDASLDFDNDGVTNLAEYQGGSNPRDVNSKPATAKVSSPLNDTGITTCANATTNGLTCPQPNFPGQDAEYGRDKYANDDSDGHAGFSYTKISSTGAELPVNASSWDCVKDNVTGLIWEVKTDDGGLHDKDWTYAWYEPNNTKNGGNAGSQTGGSCGATSVCNTTDLVQAVNSVSWCGANDWRLPNKEELRSIVDFGKTNPAIDTVYFPNSVAQAFWSSTADAYYANFVWGTNFNNGGTVPGYTKSSLGRVRLVRNGQ